MRLSSPSLMAAIVPDQVREKALQDYRKKLTEHREIDARLKEGKTTTRTH